MVSFRLDLQHDTVSDAPRHEPLVTDGEATVREVHAMLREHRRGGVLVCRNGVLEGIFTERDLVRLVATEADLGVPVRGVMSTPPVSVTETTPLAEAIRLMGTGGFRRLPVVDGGGRPVAVLKVTDVIEYLVEHVPETVHTLPPAPEPRTAEREGP